MNKIIAIAILTLKEGLRQRIFYGVSLVAVLLLGMAVMVSGFFMRDISKILVDFVLSITAVGGLLVPFFVAINMLAGDIERRTVFTVLSQPVARYQYILGKYIGLSGLSALVICFLACAGLLSVWAGHLIYGAFFFQKFHFLAYLSGVFFIYLGINVLLALVMLWCSVTTSSLLALLLTLSSYVIGHTLDDIVSFVNTNSSKNQAEEGIRQAVNWLQYIFPNLSSFDLKLAASHGILLSWSEQASLICYGVSYSIAVLLISIFAFSRRDIL